MSCSRCGQSQGATAFARRRGGLRELSRAAAKYAGARLRSAGQLAVYEGWRDRLTVCAECPLRTVVDGVAYCGRPVWQRDAGAVSTQPELGCGCPITDKARDPAEHCPLAPGPTLASGGCDCRWCRAAQPFRRGIA